MNASRSALCSVLSALLALAACSCSSSSPPAATKPAAVGSAAATEQAASRVVTETMHSDALGVDKAVLIYLPRGYDAQPARRYPVFYYLHGLGGDETNWVQSGKLDAAADELGLEAIVVMPDGDDGFYVDSKLVNDYDRCLKDGTGLFMQGQQDPAKTCVRSRSYGTYLAKDLVSWVDAKYRTIASREGRAIAGLSMGGFGALTLGMRHPELFSAAASHSGAIAMLYRGPHPFPPNKGEPHNEIGPGLAEGTPIARWLVGVFGSDLAGWRQHDVVTLATAMAAAPAASKVALYFDCGTEDSFRLHDNLQYVHEALDAKRIEHAFFLGPGGHDFDFWRARVPHSLAFLRDHTVKAR